MAPSDAAGHPVEVVALVVSPGHNYYFHGRPEGGVGPHPTAYPERVDVVAGQGIVGDRFFGRASRLRAAVSFVAAEAVAAVAADLGREAFDPRLLRRNVVVRGMDLVALREREFTLEQDWVALTFAGGRETAPCSWMDAVLAPGARAGLRGRGGLRAMPSTSGPLRVGPAVLRTAAPVVAERAGLPARPHRRLP